MKMKKEDWKQSRDFVLERYPKAVCFKYKEGELYAIFSDKNILDSERLSKNPFEGKTAKSKASAWIEAKQKIKEKSVQKQIKL